MTDFILTPTANAPGDTTGAVYVFGVTAPTSVDIEAAGGTLGVPYTARVLGAESNSVSVSAPADVWDPLDWDAQTGTGSQTINLEITDEPDDNGGGRLDVVYDINGDNTPRSIPSYTGPDTYAIAMDAADTSYDIRIAMVTSVGQAPWSALKPAVSNGAGLTPPVFGNAIQTDGPLKITIPAPVIDAEAASMVWWAVVKMTVPNFNDLIEFGTENDTRLIARDSWSWRTQIGGEQLTGIGLGANLSVSVYYSHGGGTSTGLLTQDSAETRDRKTSSAPTPVTTGKDLMFFNGFIGEVQRLGVAYGATTGLLDSSNTLNQDTIMAALSNADATVFHALLGDSTLLFDAMGDAADWQAKNWYGTTQGQADVVIDGTFVDAT